MATMEMAVEYKNRDMTPEIVATIFGKVIRRRPDVTEIIIVCKSASPSAVASARDISRHSGKVITLAPNL